MMETAISNFHTNFYIPEIQKLEFHIPHVQIMGTNHCGDSRRTTFKPRESFQDVLCCRDYANGLVASFSHQIQSEYYGGNRFVSIEGISLKLFNALPKSIINASTKLCPSHAVFNSFLSNDSKQDSATTAPHRKRFIEILKEKHYWLHH